MGKFSSIFCLKPTCVLPQQFATEKEVFSAFTQCCVSNVFLQLTLRIHCFLLFFFSRGRICCAKQASSALSSLLMWAKLRLGLCSQLLQQDILSQLVVQHLIITRMYTAVSSAFTSDRSYRRNATVLKISQPNSCERKGQMSDVNYSLMSDFESLQGYAIFHILEIPLLKFPGPLVVNAKLHVKC